MSSDTIDQVTAGQPASFSWRMLMTGQKPSPSDLRHFIDIQPVLDFSALQPGKAATDAIRQAASELKLDTTYQARTA